MATTGIPLHGGGEGGPSTMAYSMGVNGYRNQNGQALPLHGGQPQHVHQQPITQSIHPSQSIHQFQPQSIQQHDNQQIHHSLPMNNAQNGLSHTGQTPTFQHLTASVPPQPLYIPQHQAYPLPIQSPSGHIQPNSADLQNNFMLQQHQQTLNMGYVPIQQPILTPNFQFGGPATMIPGRQLHREVWPNHPEWDEDRDYGEGQDMMYGQLEVKHRRRTTPEQLKVLEHWFDVNPKPDNNLREWLAMELGMTKRNVQVWFQNRRAKMKGIALKEKAAAAKSASDPNKSDQEKTSPPSAAPAVKDETSPAQNPSPSVQPMRPTPLQLASQPQIGLVPPVNGVNMGRRASLANGEAAKIESFIAKQQRLAAAKAGMATVRQPAAGLVSPVRAPLTLQNQAQSARRKSIPYPSPIEGGSPKMSPSVRPAPSTLHLTALRNNSRRGSVPGLTGIQLISSGPFTPPRVVSAGAMSMPQAERGLSPIKDQDGDNTDYTFTETDLGQAFLDSQMNYQANSANSYMIDPNLASTFDIGPDGQFIIPSYDNTNGPLPNPAFSFGSAVSMGQTMDGQGVFTEIQPRGRLGSIASINTMTTDATTAAGGQDWDWNAGFAQIAGLEGFEPDARRASAPPDLLHNLNILGINPNLPYNTNNNSIPIRPSPLRTNPTPDGFSSFEMAQNYSGASTDSNGNTANSLFPFMGLDPSSSSTSPLSNSSGEVSPSGKNGQGQGKSRPPQLAGLHPQWTTTSNPGSAVSYTSNGAMGPPTSVQGLEKTQEVKESEEEEEKDVFAFFDLPGRDGVNVGA